MTEETLLKTIEELIKENNKLKQINNFLTTGIETIKDEAKGIAATWERQHMTDLCEGILLCADALTKKLNGEKVSFEILMRERMMKNNYKKEEVNNNDTKI